MALEASRSTADVARGNQVDEKVTCDNSSPASKRDGHAASAAERDKWRNFRDIAGDGAGYTFVPLAMESYGRLGKEAAHFLSKLGDIAAREGRVTKAAFVRAAHRRISCAIVRGNALAYGQVAAQVVQARGHAFVLGSDVPVAE